MAGSADITGRQNYVLGIGHPKIAPSTELPPALSIIDAYTSGVAGISGGDGIISNFGAQTQLKKWRKALANALCGVSNARVCLVGDSTTASLNTTGALFQNSIGSVASRIVSKSVLTANIGSTHGDPTRNNPANAFLTYDPRVGGFASWNQTSFSTAGGNAFGNNTDTTQLTFTPTDAFDTIDVYSVTNTGGTYGIWDLSIDAGASIATVDNNGPRAITKTTVSVALGVHTVKITKQLAGKQVYIVGIATRNSTVKTVDIYNLGSGSSTTTDWVGVSGGIGNLPTFQAYAPDLTIIDLGINDRRLGLYTSTFDTNMQTLITAAKATGDVILTIPVPSSYSATAFTTQQNQADYSAAIRRLAIANSCPLWRKDMLFGDYTSGNALGLYYDTIHPNTAGYGMIGQSLSSILMI